MMKLSVHLPLTVAIALMSVAHADLKAVPAPDERVAHFVLTGGVTYGGDTLETANYTNGDSVDIKAGGLIQLGAGLLLKMPDDPIALQLTANYQWDGVKAKNGDATFSRVPLEATLFYTGVDRWRFGVGARYVTSPHLHGLEDAGGQNIDFKSTTGALIDVGYRITPGFWVEGRYVFERYTPENTYYTTYTQKINANHAGIFATGIF